MKIAVEGCCHGELDKIYDTIALLEAKEGIKVDLLLCCGDFQAVRNPSDMRCMAVPPKYQRMNTFYNCFLPNPMKPGVKSRIKMQLEQCRQAMLQLHLSDRHFYSPLRYYSGEKVAPVLTVFIGGNHEASNYMQELPYGGWVAPNIYYMGYASIVNYRGVRIGGLSGIYKGRDYDKGHYEHLPYSEDSKRSVYHIRNIEVFRFKQVTRAVDIMLSHDWPTGVYNHGDLKGLLKKKPFFKEDIERGELGSPPAAELLAHLQPTYWFSAHLHVKFAAMVHHEGTDKSSKFLSLDKCLPKRKFLQILDVPHDPSQPSKLGLDPEWMCILKSTNHLFSVSKAPTFLPTSGWDEQHDFRVSDEQISELSRDFGGMFNVPENFERTAPAYHPTPDQHKHHAKEPPSIHVNPQTSLLCEMLNLVDPNMIFSGQGANLSASLDANSSLGNPDEISIDDEDEDGAASDEAPESSGYLSELSFTCSTPSQTPASGRKKRLLLPCPSNTSLENLDITGPANSSLDDTDVANDSISAPLSFNLDSIASCDSNDRDSGCSPSSRKRSEDVESSTASVECARSADPTNISGLDLLSQSSASLDSSLSTTTSDLDVSKSDIDPLVPRAKKFKRRNQSVYQAEKS